MATSIPLPALDIRPPQQQANPLEEAARVVQLRDLMQNAPLRNQLLQGQVQIQQQDLAARKAFQTASANSMTKDANGNVTFDPDKFQQGIAGTAAFTPETIESLTKMQKARVDLQTSMTDLQGKQQDMMGNAAAAIKASNYNPTVAHAILDAFPQTQQTQQIRGAIDNPDMLKQWTDTALAQSPAQQKMQNERTVAGIRANNPEMQEMNSWMNGPGKHPDGTPGTPAEYQQFKVNQGVQAAVAKETNPQVQANAIARSAAEGQARANIEAATARGSNAALATVPPHLVAPASAAAEKAGADYAQAQSVTQRLGEMMDAAKKGNVVSYQLIPQEGALQLTTSQGVHRINMAEIQNYGGGSLWQRMESHIGKALTGKSIPDSVLKDMQEMQDIQQRGAQAKYENTLNTINQTYGSQFKPVQMKNTAPAPQKPIVQHSPSTGQYRYSTDGGKTWQAGQPPQQ